MSATKDQSTGAAAQAPDPSAASRLAEYRSRASAEHIAPIAARIGRMNRGAARRVWGDVQRLWRTAKDPHTAWPAKATAIGALLYLVTPIDAIPDLIPGLGLSDDVGVILAAVGYLAYELSRDDKGDGQ